MYHECEGTKGDDERHERSDRQLDFFWRLAMRWIVGRKDMSRHFRSPKLGRRERHA